VADRKFFGTDGIRGRANSEQMTPELALTLGMAAGAHFRSSSHRSKVLIAKDTRLSGYMFESALTAGFLAVGMDVILVGPLPTPAVAMLTRSMRAELGVMISASHNPYADNGIKLFTPYGEKLSDEAEVEIEEMMQNNAHNLRVDGAHIGKAKRIEDASGRYIELIKRTFPAHLRLDGLRVVLDCAHGAAYKVAPIILQELGAECFTLGVSPNGTNINENCGSTHPETMIEAVKRHRADVGIALDGDADRVVMCDETGTLLDGDKILAIIAVNWLANKKLPEKKVVATHMSNLAFEHYLAKQGIALIRTQVGDRYVMEAMRTHKCSIGGEASGHIVCSKYATTGDGLLAALQVLEVMQEKQQRLSSCAALYTPYPQLLTNVRLKNTALAGKILDAEPVKQSIAEADRTLGGKGRTLIRKSGTEPLIRVMVEGEDLPLVTQLSREIADAISKEAAA
jgi:phosphoglucosamine mutase